MRWQQLHDKDCLINCAPRALRVFSTKGFVCPDSVVTGLVPVVMQYAKYLPSIPGPVPTQDTHYKTGDLTYKLVVCALTHDFF